VRLHWLFGQPLDVEQKLNPVQRRALSRLAIARFVRSPGPFALYLLTGFGPALALLAVWVVFREEFRRTIVTGATQVTITSGAAWVLPLCVALAVIGQVVALRVWYAPNLRRCAREIGLDLCPACGYRLRGLAAGYRCPECGAESSSPP
jgi:hypothetical protein